VWRERREGWGRKRGDGRKLKGEEFRMGNQYMKGVKKKDGWTTGKREKGRVEGEGWREREYQR
jgi:hypothetical protein